MNRQLLAVAALGALLLGSAKAQEPMKIAVIGLVHAHAWGHLPKMVAGKPATLVGVAETVPELVAEAKKIGVADNLIYADYNKMLDEKRPDIVWAFVENNRHLEIAKACAPRKIHLMFEKPLASTYKDALAIQALAKQYGIQVLTNYQMAWWPSNYTAKALVDNGTLGKVYRLRGVVGHGGPSSEGPRNKFFFDWLTDPEKNGAGALMDFGCYNALWALMYMGRPETVYATVNRLQPERFPKVEDNATIVLHWKEGSGLFEGSWDLPRSFQELEIFGRQGSAVMTNGKVEVRKGRQPAANADILPLVPEKAEPIAYMVQAIRSGKPIEGMTAIGINVGVIEIVEAAKASVKTGKPVKLAATATAK
ncbi:MAG: Gfo/Idh/MocA family oxidoreductase [Acidobacteria bacterium]|nr:Gfo/Idh/MocA family oxidoreductase [Acidobacteriota bacterium]